MAWNPSYERTLRDIRKKRFPKSPTTPQEIEIGFSKPEIMNDLGQSIVGGRICNGTQIADSYSNVIFSSPKAIRLIKRHLKPKDRFHLMDATLSIAPRGTYQQVLILHVKYGIKVRFSCRNLLFVESLIILFFFHKKYFICISDLFISLGFDDPENNWCVRSKSNRKMTTVLYKKYFIERCSRNYFIERWSISWK